MKLFPNTPEMLQLLDIHFLRHLNPGTHYNIDYINQIYNETLKRLGFTKYKSGYELIKCLYEVEEYTRWDSDDVHNVNFILKDRIPNNNRDGGLWIILAGDRVIFETEPMDFY